MIKDQKKYRILVIEDNLGDFVIVEDLLTDQITKPVITHAYNYEEADHILTSGAAFDIILLDLSLPDKKGQELVSGILKVNLLCPIIILTGYTDIDFSIKSVSQGISDYILKEDLNAVMLYKSIIYAIERKKSIAQLERSEKQFSDLFNLSPQPMWVIDAETFHFIKVNKATISLYGYSEAEFLEMKLMDILQVKDNPKSVTRSRKENNGGNTNDSSIWHIKKSGEIIEVEIYSTPVEISNKNCLSVIAIDVTEKNQFENKITRAIIKTQEDERYEIGGELHDNVCQILAASQLTLGMLYDSVPKESLYLVDLCKERNKLALDEIRNLSHRLAPAFFYNSNLEEAFKTLLDTLILEKNAQVLLHFDDSVKQYPISMEIQLNIYRILQEQVRNIHKYAKADIVDVNVLIQDQKLKLQIKDNGIGFNLGRVKKGIGLSNMKRRTELFSGKFEINTSTGNGCTLISEIPLQK